VVYLHPEADYQPQTLLAGWLGHFFIAGSLLGAGLALAFLVRSLRNRLEEQVLYLQEHRRLERQVQEASEREQRRIGENLHEDLCQRLTGLEAASKLLKKRLAAAQLPEAQLAEEIAGEIRDSMLSARQMADELQPVAMLEHGFVAALEELAARARQRADITCQVEDHGFPAKLDPFVATHLYRIAQEAVGNALRHAQASTITITLAVNDGQLTFTVRDDGVGIPEAAEEEPGTGLRIMRYHADLVGAEFDIRRAEKGGTAVLARFPRPVGGINTTADPDAGVPL
jgi:signal transduction histidine kinase